MSDSELEHAVKRLDSIIDVTYVAIRKTNRLTVMQTRALLNAATRVVTEYYEERERKNVQQA